MTNSKIIVIGAGIAGLSAAWHLQQRGIGVIILEARDRLGGRIHTSDRWLDLPVDLGASWIHGIEGNPIEHLARQYELATTVTDYDSIALFDCEGKRVTEFNWDKYAKILRRAVKTARKHWHQDGCLQTALDEILAKKALSKIELRQLNYLINTEIEHEYGADISELSVFNWDRDREFKGDDVFFPDGYARVIEILARGLDIRLKHQVNKISYNSQRVTVSTEQGEFNADKVIVTLPLGILKNQTVTFSPPLPSPKREAIALLGFGSLNKTYLRFSQSFWTDDTDLIGYIGDRQGEWMEFVNIYKYSGVPTLLGYNAGRYGSKIEAWSDERIVASMMRVLRTIYGESIPEPQDYQITRWLSDHYACGSYSFMTPGSSGKTIKDLAEPVDNCLFFAGRLPNSIIPLQFTVLIFRASEKPSEF